jgi:hypothetical protein
MRAVKGELALALVFVVLGALWIARAARMQMWEGFAPDSGFLPLVYGILLAALALAVMWQILAQQAVAVREEIRKPLLVLAALVVTVAVLPLAGFAISVFLLLVFLYGFVERLPLVNSLAVLAATTGALYLVFRTWLGVPLPVLFP